MFDGLVSGEGEVYDFTRIEEDGSRVHGFGCYGDIGWCVEKDDEDANPYEGMSEFFANMAEILADGEVLCVMAVGWEKLRYLHGAVSITAKGKPTTYATLERLAESIARELTEDEELVVDCTY